MKLDSDPEGCVRGKRSNIFYPFLIFVASGELLSKRTIGYLKELTNFKNLNK